MERLLILGPNTPSPTSGWITSSKTVWEWVTMRPDTWCTFIKRRTRNSRKTLPNSSSGHQRNEGVFSNKYAYFYTLDKYQQNCGWVCAYSSTTKDLAVDAFRCSAADMNCTVYWHCLRQDSNGQRNPPLPIIWHIFCLNNIMIMPDRIPGLRSHVNRRETCIKTSWLWLYAICEKTSWILWSTSSVWVQP